MNKSDVKKSKENFGSNKNICKKPKMYEKPQIREEGDVSFATITWSMPCWGSDYC